MPTDTTPQAQLEVALARIGVDEDKARREVCTINPEAAVARFGSAF